MPPKYRMTGCAKFFLFLLIAAPLAYMGANYVNSGDPLAGLRSFIGTGENTEAEPPESKAENAQITKLEAEIARLKEELEACQQNQKNQ